MTKVELMRVGRARGVEGMRMMSKQEISEAVEASVDARLARSAEDRARPIKFYIDKSVVSKSADLRESLEKAPKQLRDIVETMVSHKVTSRRSALTAHDVVDAGVRSGVITTRLRPAVLFRYYLKRLIELGVKRA